MRCKISFKIRPLIDELLGERRKNVRVGWRDSEKRTNDNGDLWVQNTLLHLVLVFCFPMCFIVGSRAKKPTKNGQKRTTLVSQRRILTNLVSSVAQKRGRWPICLSEMIKAVDIICNLKLKQKKQNNKINNHLSLW